jgi:hypothetical protein
MLTLSKSQNLFLKKKKEKEEFKHHYERLPGKEMSLIELDEIPNPRKNMYPRLKDLKAQAFWVLAFQDLGHGIMTKNQPNLTQKQLKKPDLERKSKGKIKKKKKQKQN